MRPTLALATLLTLALSGGCRARPQSHGAGASPLPTFTRDVAPILFAHCVPCHRPGQPVPFTLLRYADASNRADKIAKATGTRKMPPWLPDPIEPAFLGERRLNDDQIEIIRRWAATGAMEGNRLDLPRLPKLPEGWQLGQPDLVITMPRPYLLEPGARDVFRNVVLQPLSLPANRFVRAVEFRTNGAPIHHAIIRVDRTPASRQRDGEDGKPGYEGMMPDVQNPAGYFIGWAPGRGPIIAPEGMPWRLNRDSDLVVELHLLPGKTAVPVQPTVGLFFADRPPVHEPVMLVMGSKMIEIPAGATDYAISDAYVLPVDLDLLSVYPHAHFLGKDMQVQAALPDGSTRSLIHIRQWSFHWQQDYRYATPIALPRGTTITMRYTYDNSDRNEDNPHHPPQPVIFGQTSTDEMGNLGLQVLPRSSADAAVLVKAFVDREKLANVAAAEMLVRHAPDKPENQHYLGLSYAEVGRIAEAIPHFEAAIRLNPKSAYDHNELGGALLAQHRIQDALAHAQQAVALAPQDAHLHYNLANVLNAAGLPTEAAKEFQRAIALKPDFAEAYGTLGALLFAHDRLADAIVQFRRAADLAPDSAIAQSDLGAALAQAGQIDEALRHLQRALELNPDDATTRENLARLQKRRMRK